MVGAVVSDPGYWQMLKAEKWPMRLVIGVGLLIAGSHGLHIVYLLFLGVTGEGWYSEALMYSVVWVWLISAWIGRRYWRRRALAAKEAAEATERARLIDIALGDHADLEQVWDAMRKLNWGPLPTVDDLEAQFATLINPDGSTLKLNNNLWDEKR